MPWQPPSSGMTLFTGNRLEDMADLLARVLDRPLADPLSSEVVIIQSRGMERWIAMALADRLGVCANVRFPFPNAFLDEVLAAVFQDISPQVFMDRDTLTFRMMTPLADAAFQGAAPELAAYLMEDDDALKNYQLARHLSDRFDQYAVFRPDMVAGWLSGTSTHWQARLWRRVYAESGRDHRAVRLERLVQMLASSDGIDPTIRLPRRVSLFGISYLPPLYTTVFRALAAAMEVNLFLLNPCQEYWAQIRPQRKIRRAIAAAPGVGEPAATWLHLETGNRLLASWGGLGQEYFDRLCAMDEVLVEDVFTDPGDDTLLHRLQSDILYLRDEDMVGGEGDDPADAGDDSVQVHACHSPMREVEALHDNVLHFLETLPGLTPADILVMTPDIDTYAPLIEAVFGTQGDRALRIPFHTADRSGATGRPVVQAFLTLLDLRRRRLTVSEVSALMAWPFVLAAWDITDADMAVFRQWIEDTVIRWGIDGHHRSRLELPGAPTNTWREGIRRLLMGYAVGDGPTDLVADILPYTPVEGSDAVRFGRVIDFLETLFDTVDAMENPRRLGGWASFLLPLAGRFFAADAVDPGDLQFLTRNLHRLEELEKTAGFNQPVDITLVAAWLSDVCSTERTGGFLSGGLTVCAMLPMRSIPARVICLLGMSSDGFPRRDRQSGIDLMAQSPRPGDRSARSDDRYLFLEAVTSARDVLCISYVGQSVTDNAPLPPSVLVSELVDYMGTRFGVAEPDLVRRHRLQPFSHAYFSGEGPLFSYSAENCVLPALDLPARPLLDGLLPEPPSASQRIPLDELCRFFQHPSRYLATQRLGIVIPAATEALEDREPFALDGRNRWILGNDLLMALVNGESEAALRRAHLASGILAPGGPGLSAYDRLCRDVHALHRRIRGAWSGPFSSESVTVSVDGAEIAGSIGGLSSEGRIEYRFGKLRPADRISGWIRHLLWQAHTGKRIGLPSRLIAEDETLTYRPVASPEAELAFLVSLYHTGLREPLPFLPNPSYAYAVKWQSGKWPSQQRLVADMAAADLSGRGYGSGEVGADPYVALCWRQRAFFDTPFAKTSLSVCEPMMAHEDD